MPGGRLPEHEQGSLDLIVAGARGALIRLSQTTPEANLLKRSREMTLATDGSVSATITEQSNGQAAAVERNAFCTLSESE